MVDNATTVAKHKAERDGSGNQSLAAAIRSLVTATGFEGWLADYSRQAAAPASDRQWVTTFDRQRPRAMSDSLLAGRPAA